MVGGLTIGYTCNVRPAELDADPRYGEWEGSETINSVINSFEKTGNRVILLDADKDIYHKLLRHTREIDIVFNNAEGFKEVGIREAAVPFFCDYLNVPYSGSGPQTLMSALDKPTTKEILRNYGIVTPLFQRMDSYTDRLEKGLSFPLMVKPASEGTSIGITQESRVDTNKGLARAVKRIITEYSQPALVEEFVEGDEYTVGITGKYVWPILKLSHDSLPEKQSIRDPHVKEIEIPFVKVMSYGEKGYRNLARQTAIAFEALSCNDYCRMDFRKGKGEDGEFYFLEMNPLPGINPTTSDLPIMVRHTGLTYEEMINMILWEAIKRNRENKDYAGIFTEDKIAGVRDLTKSAKAKLGFYNKRVPADMDNGDAFRLVRTRKEGGELEGKLEGV